MALKRVMIVVKMVLSVRNLFIAIIRMELASMGYARLILITWETSTEMVMAKRVAPLMTVKILEKKVASLVMVKLQILKL